MKDEKEIIENTENKENSPSGEEKEVTISGKEQGITESGEAQLSDEAAEDQDINEKISLLEREVAEWKDKYLRLAAEFDNYRKRTLKEKMELIKTASKDLLENMLPVMDDFDRAAAVIEEATDLKGIKEGYALIASKYRSFLASHGVREMDVLGKVFTTDEHEAVAKTPVEDESMKGKVIDIVQKGYYLNDSILRFAKVVVAE